MEKHQEEISPGQVRAARALLGWPQSKLAKESGVSIPTVRAALTRANVIFLDQNGEGPGVRLRRRK